MANEENPEQQPAENKEPSKPVSEYFDNLNDGIRGAESSVVNFLSVFAPWLAPLIPAYMTYQHAIDPEGLAFPWPIALAGALVVEILGFSAVNTILQFYFYNKQLEREMQVRVAQKRKGKKPVSRVQMRKVRSRKRAPVWVVTLAFMFYLALIVVSNVVLDSFPDAAWALPTVRALFTLQTIPAALIVAVRTQHRDLLAAIKKEQEKRAANRSETFRKVSDKEQKVSESLPANWRQARKQLSSDEVAWIAQATTEQVATKYGLIDKTAYNWRTYAYQELHPGNGHAGQEAIEETERIA
jgi:hypothetical protein